MIIGTVKFEVRWHGHSACADSNRRDACSTFGLCQYHLIIHALPQPLVNRPKRAYRAAARTIRGASPECSPQNAASAATTRLRPPVLAA